MSKTLPNICYYNHNEYSFQRPYSETTAREIDKEVLQMVNEQYTRAKNILMEHKEGHNALAELLIQKEVIMAEDVEHIFGKRPWLSRSQEIMEDEQPKIDDAVKDMPEVQAAIKEHEEAKKASKEEAEENTSEKASAKGSEDAEEKGSEKTSDDASEKGYEKTGEPKGRRNRQPIHYHRGRSIFLPCRSWIPHRYRGQLRGIRTILAHHHLPLHRRALYSQQERHQRLGLHHAFANVHCPSILDDQRVGI